MKKRYLLSIIILLVGCKDYQDPKLESFISNSIKQDSTHLSFTDYNKDQWNRLYIIPPYTFEGMLNNDLKPYQKQIFSTNIHYLDNFQLLLLLKNDELVSLTKIAITYDFSESTKIVNGKIGYYSPNEAIFQVKPVSEAYYIKPLQSSRK